MSRAVVGISEHPAHGIKMIHGTDEYITLRDLEGAAHFYARLIATVLFIAVLVAVGSARAEGLPRFVRERVVVTLLEDGFQVEGTYVFRRMAPGEMTFSIRYPFPAEPGTPPAELVAVRNAQVEARAPGAVTLFVSLDPTSPETVVEITYRQQWGTRHARYLVTTARAWGRPLERGEFLVRAPLIWGNPHSSWPLPAAGRHGQTSEWRWIFEPFVPKSELDVSWTVP